MKIDKENWRDIDINIDSLWVIGPRAKGGKRENNYHGNFVPQVPDHLIRRYTEEGETVLDMFMGSGTTLFECERLKRNYIGFDINEEIISYVQGKMNPECGIKYYINNCNVCDSEHFSASIQANLKELGSKCYDFLIMHPPYWNIIKFTDKPEDLSNISDMEQFISTFTASVQTALTYLRTGRHFALVIGDIYRDSEVVPLGFYLMDSIHKNCKCKLKGIVVKDIVGNRGKAGMEDLWRYRTLKSDTFLFKHEYIMVFKKG